MVPLQVAKAATHPSTSCAQCCLTWLRQVQCVTTELFVPTTNPTPKHTKYFTTVGVAQFHTPRSMGYGDGCHSHI